MYAVFKSGGKQHRVQQGDTLKLEKLELETGATVEFDTVLMVGEGDQVEVGAPYVSGSKVSAEVVSHGRDKKVNIIKFRRRKHHLKRMGHRQWFTEVKITGIAGAGAKAAPKKAAENSAAPKPAAPKAAEPKAEAKPVEQAEKAAPKAAPAGSGDDLSKLSGVGPVLVEKLTNAGITTFKQIAEFTPEEIARIDEELSFKGRIERDGWVEQAKQLMKEGE